MNEKKCPLCGCDIEENVELCSDCQAKQECEQTVDEQIQTENVVSEEVQEAAESAQAASEAPKAKKGVVILCAVMAVILVLVAGGFYMHSNSWEKVIDVSSFGMDDLNGRYTCETAGAYIDFDATEITTDVVTQVPVEETADSAAGSDASAASSAEPQFVSEERTFDGSYTLGLTDEVINQVLIETYIGQNNLTEEYEAFLAENNIQGDGTKAYAELKGITQEDLDSMSGAEEIRKQAAEQGETGYWNYNEENKQIEIYGKYGSNVYNLIVHEGGLVSDRSFSRGKTKKDKPFNSHLVYENKDYGITNTIITYEDGNYVISQAYEGNPSSVTNGGSYVVKDGIMEINVNGNVVAYTILKDGIAGEVYTK